MTTTIATTPTTTTFSIDYREIEADGRHALLYESHGEISDLPERLATALADMRRQRDRAREERDENELIFAHWEQGFETQLKRAEAAETQLADMRRQRDEALAECQFWKDERFPTPQPAEKEPSP